jgi:hypothetical protein
VARLLGDLETYVSGQSNIIIDYATARRREVSSISLFDGLPITEIDGLPTSASQVL